MLIRHMEYFVTLAEEEHFGRAAQLCGVSQPTLSQAIKKLEDDLGVSLIVRGKRYMGLTAEGERILPWGRQILANFDSLKDDLSGRRKGGLTGVLRLGVHPAAMAAVTRLTKQFEARNPLASISILPFGTTDILRMIAAHALDGGVIWDEGAPLPNVEKVLLEQQEMMFACPSDHPFAAEKSIPWRDAMTQPLVTLEGGLPVPTGADGQPLVRSRVGCGSLAAVLAHMRTGRWCAVVPDGFSALLAPQDDLVLRPMIQPSLTLPLVGVVSDRAPQSPMTRALSACLHTIAVS